MDNLSKEFNAINKNIAALRKVGRSQILHPNHCAPSAGALPTQAGNSSPAEVEQLSARSRSIKAGIAEARLQEETVREERDSALLEIGNVIRDDVPVAKDEVRCNLRFLQM